MEWHWYDSDRDEQTRWWTIDPLTGEPDGDSTSEWPNRHCLGESVLDDVSLVADNIATIFVTKHFTNEDMSALILERKVPASFQGGSEDAADLVEAVDELWSLTEHCYQQALGRQLDQVERHWLAEFAVAVMRAREA